MNIHSVFFIFINYRIHYWQSYSVLATMTSGKLDNLNKWNQIDGKMWTVMALVEEWVFMVDGHISWRISKQWNQWFKLLPVILCLLYKYFCSECFCQWHFIDDWIQMRARREREVVPSHSVMSLSVGVSVRFLSSWH